jgi:chloramphenicol 3-O-phosphotransferase
VARVIYLNGTSSAGKSTIARALHERLDDLYLDVPLDVFLWMVPRMAGNSREEPV